MPNVCCIDELFEFLKLIIIINCKYVRYKIIKSQLLEAFRC